MNYEVAPFPLNDPLTPTTLEVHAIALAHCMQFAFKKFLANFKIS